MIARMPSSFTHHDDPRRAADRDAPRCEHCGRFVRWIENSRASREGARMQIEARMVAPDTWFEAGEHRGMVAVFRDGSGFTVSRFTPASAVEGAWLYRCHWDVCDAAASERDALSRVYSKRRARAERHEAEVRFHEAVDRYAHWRHTRDTD